MASESVARTESFAAFIPELERLIAVVMQEWEVPGLAVAVVQNGEVAFVGPYGLRDVEAGLKVTTDTQFQLMSVSKSFAATGLGILVDEQRMDWKKPVREYIPEFRLHDAVASDRVTVRDLLCHHSGLPRHDWIWLPGDLSPAQMLGAMRYLELSDDIRSTFQYSNLGYLVASMVAERVGGQSWAEFTRALTDKLHMDVTFTVEELAATAEKLLVVKEKDAEGNTVERERRTTANHAMKSCRRAWYVAHRRNPGKLPLVNPFAKMGLESSDRETPTATFAELEAFRAKAIAMGLQSLATAALIGWEWLQREIDIFGTFEVSHYRPKEHPNAVRVVHEKTGEENWIPLLDERTGAPFFPILMAELDSIKKVRIGGLMLRRDWGKHDPWPTFPREDEIDLTHMSRKVKEVIRATGLRDELTFTSFRHGGFTEAGNAELTDRELMAQGRHKSPKVLKRYVKRTMRQVAKGIRKRQAERTKKDDLSE